MKKTTIVAAVILIALGIIILAGAWIMSGFDFSKFETVKYETRTYTVEADFRNMEIDADDMDVEFKPSDDGEFRLVCLQGEKTNCSAVVENGTLKVAYEDKGSWTDNFGISFKSPSMTLYLPEREYGDLSIVSDTGDVSIPEDFSFDRADIAVDTGDVVFGASVGGAVTLGTKTGAILFSGDAVGELSLNSGTGNIEIDTVSCAGDVSLSVDTGDARLTGLGCSSLSAKADTGNIRMKDCFAAESMTLRDGTGDISFDNCDAGEISAMVDTGDIKGTLASEKVFLTRADTGDINVPGTVTGGKCELTVGTGDIEISLVNG